MALFQLSRRDALILAIFALVVITMPVWTAPFGANYPGLMQKFAIYAIFAIGFNILFGLTGYLSFGHAAFLGVGSYTAVWSFKLLTMDALPALVFAVLLSGLFALVIGFLSLRRSGIYFSILTLAFAQMSYNLAYSVLTPITNGETSLQLTLQDPRLIDLAFAPRGAGLPTASLFGTTLSGLSGFYFCAVVLLIAFFFAQKIFASPFGMMLRGIKSNQMRMSYTGFNTRPYALTAFVISGMYAGLAGALLAVTDPLAGAERMLDGIGRSGADDHPRRRRHADRAGDGRLADQVFREHFLLLQRGHFEPLLRFHPRAGARHHRCHRQQVRR